MHPRIYGIETLNHQVIIKTPSDKVNVDSLIKTFESNLDKAASKDWLDKYNEIFPIYKTIFTYGELPEAMLEGISYELLEMAEENISQELYVLIDKPQASTGKDYYYEFARSLGVESQAANLNEYLDEDCDFI
ncbi:hypothetical protein ABFV99_13735 [Cytobacillus horneckiae]|uniref:hypothetical protein n=1 Tax=Cytobacillus horneckiae TaxID=549687 RepID=UPI0034CEABA1